MIRTLLASALALSLSSSIAFAEGAPGAAAQVPAAQPSAATAAPASNSISAPFKIQAPQIGAFKLRAGLKSQNTTARVYEFDNANGKRYQQKHEYYLGVVHESGWGAYGQAVTSGGMYAGTGKDNVGAGDPSLTILHPDWYRGSSLTLAGQYRGYFPVTDRSLGRQIYQQAYYFYTTYKLPRLWTLFNQTTPRYFIQNHYEPQDTTWYLEDLGTITKQLTSRWAAGVGEWTQIETHSQTATGVAVDVEGFVRYTPIQNLWIEPRLILPAYIKNSVFDSAKTVSLGNARAELYAQMTL